MPFKQGYNRSAVSANIGELIRAGRKPKQAAAIAFDVARKSAKKAGKLSSKSRKESKNARSLAIQGLQKQVK